MSYQEQMFEAELLASEQVERGTWTATEVAEWLEIKSEKAGDKMSASKAKSEARRIVRDAGKLILG